MGKHKKCNAKRLIILSDLWGREKSEWINIYIQLLENDFDIEYYDCCELGEIDKSDYTEENLHKQFINGGIIRAVERLIEIEKGKVNILAFSIGGTVAWKFGIACNRINSLTCVSSTRLRHETIRPKGKITIYFGGNDVYKPEAKWFGDMMLNPNIISDKEHQFYMEYHLAEKISNLIIENDRNDTTSLDDHNI